MVKLNRIYTRTGDDGSTGLADGSRVGKDELRIAAYGTVDELNSVMGLAVGACAAAQPTLAERLERLQHDLFDLGADLATPGTGEGLRIQAAQVKHLESEIDLHNRDLPALDSFVLPGGSAASQWLHLARTVCRRAERETVALSREEEINPEAIRYLNRLSDLLFVCARVANGKGSRDVLWIPGQNREEEA
jgi:cob(I)alamin adenosyltransferase